MDRDEIPEQEKDRSYSSAILDEEMKEDLDEGSKAKPNQGGKQKKHQNEEE